MSRILKIGFATAIQCLNQVPDCIPEAIIIGTGKGSLTDTEQFLNDIKIYHETALNAMPFIQSTYNQLNGMIALNRHIDSYSMTYTHRGLSLEHALYDAMLLMYGNDIQTALVGSYDEMTRDHFRVKNQWGYWKSEEISNMDLIESQTTGSIAGEGSGFFMLSTQPFDSHRISINYLTTLYKPSAKDISDACARLLQHSGIAHEDIDVLILGRSGDANTEHYYQQVEQQFPKAEQAFFKHLCGEYDTASHMAIWLAHSILIHQQIPALCKVKSKVTSSDKIRYLLIYNNYYSIHHSFILLEKR